ncbi:lysM and putative peptidoglycan-binding domain-containing protein 1 [Myiozetetes cayanensis]|uniref:lysM and putative peptidoglycan-binding domain-containing protein 1 n=1 Tax=Myiozetetes cayanensis TaxID=478635 RepID=UPI002160318C|nr:lysM and putative peptidoglycan-binding domain-containing protein 1 [Myiozetetes cayanensis]
MAGSGGAGAAPREHRLQPGDTLAGLALRYGVTMEQIQRANRLYTSDTIFLKPTLLIPGGSQAQPLLGDEPRDVPDPPEPPPSRHDLSAVEFLRRLDREIGRSKEAAALQNRQRHTPGDPGPSDSGASQRIPEGPSSPREGPRLGPRPLTRTPRAAALRDTEDEICTL